MTTRLFKKVVPLQDVQVGDLLWYDTGTFMRLLLVLNVKDRSDYDAPFECLVLYLFSDFDEFRSYDFGSYIDRLALDGGPLHTFVAKGDK
jgi:hypothetical protein